MPGIRHISWLWRAITPRAGSGCTITPGGKPGLPTGLPVGVLKVSTPEGTSSASRCTPSTTGCTPGTGAMVMLYITWNKVIFIVKQGQKF